MEGRGHGRPFREDPEIAGPHPWLSKLQEGAWLQGESTKAVSTIFYWGIMSLGNVDTMPLENVDVLLLKTCLCD